MYFTPAPPKFDPPTFQEIVSDTEIRVTLHPASNENGDVTHYYVIVVNNDLAEGRQPSDFRLDEVIRLMTSGTFRLYVNPYFTDRICTMYEMNVTHKQFKCPLHVIFSRS